MTFYSAQHDYFACAIFFLFFSVTAAPHAKNSESSPIDRPIDGGSANWREKSKST